MKSLDATFREKMFKLRKDRHLSQSEFAADLGLSVSTISNIERGVASWASHTLDLAINKYSLSLDYFFTDSIDRCDLELLEILRNLSSSDKKVLLELLVLIKFKRSSFLKNLLVLLKST